DVPRHRDTSGFNLPVSDPRRLQALQPILTEADLAATSRDASHASAHLLSVLNFLRHQHSVSLISVHKSTNSNNQLKAFLCALCAFLWLLVFRSRSASIRSAFAFSARARSTLAFTGAGFVDRIRSGATGHRGFGIHDLATIDPNLDTD